MLIQSKANKNQISMENGKINIADVHKETLRTEFKVSQQTIRMSLDNYFKSKKAQEIRKRALELMEKDVEAARKIVMAAT